MRTNRHIASAALLTLGALASACADVGLAPNEMDHGAVIIDQGSLEPDHVLVEHCLIAVEESGLPGVSRTVDEGSRLARQVLDQARTGTSFAQLVQRYSDDRGSDGSYSMANFGVTPATSSEVPRGKMVRAFGDVSFGLGVGEYGFTEYDAKTSKYGFHVIHRLR